jgi:N-acetylmuramoyl-L-alanine amidase
MPRTIFLSAGHGGADPGAVANGYIERDLAIELRLLVANELKSRYSINAKLDPNQNKLIETLKWLAGKFLTKDILFDIHWNAGGGTGIEVIVPEVSSNFERTLAQTLADRISAITGWKKRGGGVKPESSTARKRLGWMRPNAENILIEVCFIDNKTDMALYESNKVTIAKTIAQILSNFSKL